MAHTEINRLIIDKDHVSLLNLCEDLELEFALYPFPTSTYIAPMQQPQPARDITSANDVAMGARSCTPPPPSNTTMDDTTSSNSSSPTRPPQRAPLAIPASISLLPAALEESQRRKPARDTRPIQPFDARIYLLNFLVCLHQGSTDHARMLMRRMPKHVKETQDFQAVLPVAEFLHAKDTGTAVSILTQLLVDTSSAVSPASAADKQQGGKLQWMSPWLPSLLLSLLDAVREREARLIERAYETIEVSRAAQKLGLSFEETIIWAKGRVCWNVDEQGGWLRRVALPKEVAVGGGPGLMQIADLTSYVVALER